MRNLKRALSLTLASVMLLGMMVVGTSALSFNDAEDISNVTAATVLEELGVMVGDGQGNFMPDQSVTRAQMAILICRILYGDKLNVSQFEGTTQYTDVPVSEYYTGYINLASSLGIIKGYGDGKFGPDDTVTTAQAALMLCRALGWFQAGEMTGDWGSDALTAISRATRINMFGDLKLSTNALLSRDNVAEMVFNTITKTNPVQYSERWDNYFTDEGGVIEGVKFHYRDTLGYKNFDLVYKEGGKDEFGRPSTEWGTGSVTAYTDDGKGDIKTSTIKDSFIKSADTADATYTKEVKISDIYKDLGLSEKVASANVKFIRNNADTGLKANDGTTSLPVDVAKGSTEKIGGKGTLTEVYYDSGADTSAGEKIVTVVMIDYFLAQANEDYDSKDGDVRVTLKANATPYTLNTGADKLEVEDFPVIASVKKDDYLVVTVVYDGTSKYDIKTVAAPTVVEDQPVSNARANDYVTAGQKYEYSDVSKKSGSNAVGQNLMADSSKYKLNDDGYDLYLDPNGFVLGVEAHDGGVNVGDYLFVKDRAGNDFDGRAKVLFTDGTTKNVTVDKLIATNGTETDIDKNNITSVDTGKFYKYSTDKDGNYELTVVDNSDPAAANNQGNATAAITSSAKPLGNSNPTGTADTVFIAKDKVFTGVKNAPEVTSGTVYWVNDNDGNLLIVFADRTGSNKTSSDELVYILNSNPARNKDGDTPYYTYDVVRAGEGKTTLDANDNNKPAGIYKIDSISDGRADLGTALVDYETYKNDATVTNKDQLVNILYDLTSAKDNNGSVSLDSNGYLLAEGAEIYTIDGNTVESISASGLERAVETDHFNNAVVIEVSSSDDDISVIFLSKTAPAATAIASKNITSGSQVSSSGVAVGNTTPTKGSKVDVSVSVTGSVKSGVTGDLATGTPDVTTAMGKGVKVTVLEVNLPTGNNYGIKVKNPSWYAHSTAGTEADDGYKILNNTSSWTALNLFVVKGSTVEIEFDWDYDGTPAHFAADATMTLDCTGLTYTD